MGGAYYNEHEPVAAEWLRRLIVAKLIPPGEVDERDIRDVAPDELRGFVQCHFFAGIGIWPHALRRAGWPDDRPIWSGSCPCQPFSDAGRKGGSADERHLWPHWHWLIEQLQPQAIVGEQVASKDGLGWLDLVSADLEGTGYAFGAADLCAAGFGMDWRSSAWSQWLQRAVRDCPDPMVAGWIRHFAEWADQSLVVGGQHIRQRLYFAAFRLADLAGRGWGVGGDAALAGRGGHLDSSGDPSGGLGDRERERSQGHAGHDGPARGWKEPGRPAAAPSLSDRVGNSNGGPERGRTGALHGTQGAGHDGPSDGHSVASDPERLGDSESAGTGAGLRDQREGRRGAEHTDPSSSGGLADPDHDQQRGGRGAGGEGEPGDESGSQPSGRGEAVGASEAGQLRAPFDWVFCRDGFWRPVEPGASPLAHAVAGRVGKLRSYGNGLDAETATGFAEIVNDLWEEVSCPTAE